MWHFKVTMATLQNKLEMLQTSQSGASIVSLHGGGGPSLIIAPRTRDHACMQLHCGRKEWARIHEEMGENQGSPPCHSLHEQPQLAGV